MKKKNTVMQNGIHVIIPASAFGWNATENVDRMKETWIKNKSRKERGAMKYDAKNVDGIQKLT